jgi:hypothetical protein
VLKSEIKLYRHNLSYPSYLLFACSFQQFRRAPWDGSSGGARDKMKEGGEQS